MARKIEKMITEKVITFEINIFRLGKVMILLFEVVPSAPSGAQGLNSFPAPLLLLWCPWYC